ncbi:hypothetical protein Bca4012_004219 [Brassica carinata]
MPLADGLHPQLLQHVHTEHTLRKEVARGLVNDPIKFLLSHLHPQKTRKSMFIGPEEPFLLGHASDGERFRRRKRGIEKIHFISTLSSSCSLIDEGGDKITASSPRRTKSKKGAVNFVDEVKRIAGSCPQRSEETKPVLSSKEPVALLKGTGCSPRSNRRKLPGSVESKVKGVDDESFDQYFDHHFDQQFEKTFENFSIGDHGEERKRRKKELISKEIVKKAISVYGMIISVKLQYTLKIFSDDNLE